MLERLIAGVVTNRMPLALSEPIQFPTVSGQMLGECYPRTGGQSIISLAPATDSRFPRTYYNRALEAVCPSCHDARIVSECHERLIER